MPDISLCCAPEGCPLAEDCIRNPAFYEPIEERQSYMMPVWKEGKCESFREE